MDAQLADLTLAWEHTSFLWFSNSRVVSDVDKVANHMKPGPRLLSLFMLKSVEHEF